MIDLAEIMRRLSVNAEAMWTLVGTISVEQAQWKPAPEAWSIAEVMDHVYNEERVDFRRHLMELFSDPPKAWDEIPVAWNPVSDCRKALDGFFAERQDSLGWLKGLSAPDWDRKMAAPWGGEISAGDLLVSWVAHDYLHMRQMNELAYAWNEQQAAPYAVAYAGGW